MVIRFADAAAHDLGIDLEIISADNRFDKRKAFVEVLNRPEKVDAVVIKIEYETESQFLDLAEQVQVPLLTFNTSFDQEMAEVVGKPREKYQYWLGEIFPMKYKLPPGQPGFYLMKPGEKNCWMNKVDYSLSQSVPRKIAIQMTNACRGFLDVLERSEDVILHQIAYSNWKSEKARFAFSGLIKRYPQTKVVWAAARDRAIRSEAKEKGLVPGTDFVINSNRFLNHTL